MDRAHHEIADLYVELFSCSESQEERELTEVIVGMLDKIAAENKDSDRRRPKTKTELEIERGYWDKNSPHYMGGSQIEPIQSEAKPMPAGGIVHEMKARYAD